MVLEVDWTRPPNETRSVFLSGGYLPLAACDAEMDCFEGVDVEILSFDCDADPPAGRRFLLATLALSSSKRRLRPELELEVVPMSKLEY